MTYYRGLKNWVMVLPDYHAYVYSNLYIYIPPNTIKLQRLLYHYTRVAGELSSGARIRLPALAHYGRKCFDFMALGLRV